MGVDYAFFSASTLEGVAAGLQHGMERTVLFEIECLRTCPGVDVSVLSVCPGEKEVLFAPCTGLSLVQPAVPVDGGLGGGGGARVLRAGAEAGHALVEVFPAAAKESSNSNTATLQHCNIKPKYISQSRVLCPNRSSHVRDGITMALCYRSGSTRRVGRPPQKCLPFRRSL